MASKYVKECIPLENTGVSLTLPDEKPVPEERDKVFMTVKSNQKVLVVVTTIVIVIIVIGALIGTVMALRYLKNDDNDEPNNGTQNLLHGKEVTKDERTTYSSLVLGTITKTSSSGQPLSLLPTRTGTISSKIALRAPLCSTCDSNVERVRSTSSTDVIEVHTATEPAPPSTLHTSPKGTITKSSLSANILTLPAGKTTISSSKITSLSSSDDIYLRTSKESVPPSLIRSSSHAEMTAEIRPSVEILSTSTHHLEVTTAFSSELPSATSVCSNCDDVSAQLSSWLNDVDVHTTAMYSPLSSIMQLVPNADAKWSRWSPWSECSKTCGNGTRVRSRICVAQDPTAVFAPISCAGKAQQNKTCSEWTCPDCLKTCIKGTLNAACDACTCHNHTLTGRVQAKSSAPIFGAKVTLSETPYNVLAQTDDKGFFKAFNVCTDANQELLISGKGFVPVKVKATVLTSTTADVRAQLEIAVPPSITVHPESKMRFSGDGVTFCCDGEGNPPPEIEWFKDNNIIDKDTYNYGKTLKISNVSGLQGSYRCRVVNDFGSEFSISANLRVFGSRDIASCNPIPSSKNATLPAGCFINGTTNNTVDVGECVPAPCLRNDSILSNETCEEETFCCTVEEVADITVSCGSSVTFSVSKATRCGCNECEKPRSKITGVVVGLKGTTEKPIAYCKLEFEGFSYRADYNGFFTFEAPSGKQRLSVMFKDDFDEKFADLTKVFRIQKGQTSFIKIMLKPKPAPKPFNSSEDFKVQLGDTHNDSAFAEMEIPKDALLKDDGSTFFGQANLQLNVIDPRNVSDILTAPADFSAIDEDGEEQMLVTYGMFSFDFEDDSGNKLSPSKAIKLYLDPEKLNISVGSDGNTTTKLWWLDTKTGRWIEAGDLRVEEDNSGRSRRSPTRFVLEAEITPAISRQYIYNVDYPELFGAVRVVGPVGSTVRILCEEPDQNRYTGYLEGTVDNSQVACITVWIAKKCYMQGESVNSRFLEPKTPDSFPASVSATIVSNQNLQSRGSSNIQSFKFDVKTSGNGPIFPYYRRFYAPESCKAPYLTPNLLQFVFENPTANQDLNLITPRTDNPRNPLNWYPTNNNCFIKLLIHGVTSAVFLASSHKPNKGAKFGDSIVMAEQATNQVNAYVACLEIRCPGLVHQAGSPVKKWTHVLVTQLTGNCNFQKHYLLKQNNLDGKGTNCTSSSTPNLPGSETWLCIPLSDSGFDIDRVYQGNRNSPTEGESRCKVGNNKWSLGRTVKTNTVGPTAEFSCS